MGGHKTREIWQEYFTYALKGLRLKTPLTEDKKEALNVIFDDICDLKSEDSLFQDILLTFLDELPPENRSEYIGKVTHDIERFTKNFSSANMPRFYKYLNKSSMETLNYLMENADKFDKEHFNAFLRTVNID